MRKLISLLLITLAIATASTVGSVAVDRPQAAQAAELPRVPIMGPNILRADQIAAWFNSKGRPFNVPGIIGAEPRADLPLGRCGRERAR